MTRVLGVDPGLASCGWAVLSVEGRALSLVAHGCVVTSPDDGDDITRAVSVASAVGDVARAHEVKRVVSEAWRHYEQSDATTAHTMGLVVGALAMAARACGVEFREGPRAQEWRVALGLPRTATKAQCQERVRAALGLAKVIKPQHASDAASLAMVAAMRGGRL